MKTIHPARFIKPTALAMALLLVSASVSAQSTESLSVPVGTVHGDKPAAPAEVDYVVPDLKTKPNGGMHQVNDYFSFKPSLALLEDFTYIDQDADSIAQVGDQADRDFIVLEVVKEAAAECAMLVQWPAGSMHDQALAVLLILLALWT